jgi:hypothetical protein
MSWYLFGNVGDDVTSEGAYQGNKVLLKHIHDGREQEETWTRL